MDWATFPWREVLEVIAVIIAWISPSPVKKLRSIAPGK